MIATLISPRFTALGLLVLALATGCNRSNATNEGLAQDMIGTWVHVGRPGQVREAPTEGGRFKYRTGTHWAVIGVDPVTGLVKENFGGSYAMNGDEYIETQAYADETWLHDNGNSFKFIVKIDGDLMTQVGVDNPFTEVWKRVKAVTAVQ